jgi:hypothetical protein
MSLATDVQELVLERLAQLHPEIAQWQQEKKEIGRNAGSVFVAGDIRYFVKRQGLCMRTLYVYHLLSALGLGPQHFFVLAHRRSGDREEFDHIIATRAVPGFRMASQQGDGDGLNLLPMEDAVCLSLLVCCFDLDDIPNNTDNWGTATSDRLAIVDFSVGMCVVQRALSNLRDFMGTCRPLALTDEDVDDAVAMASFLRVYGPWFASRSAFERLLETTMNRVIDWTNDDVHQKEWRRSQSLHQAFYLVEELARFQHIARKKLKMFAPWRK